MESVEELCDHIALIHKANKILDGKLNDIKRTYKTNTFEVGLQTKNVEGLTKTIQEKFEVLPATFKSLNDDLKLNIKLNGTASPNELLSFLTSKAEVHHFVEVIPSVNDILIQTVKSN
jgi:ABC-2 type transport system ATP-binding protein